MKLDVKDFRYLGPEDWRVLTAAEMGSKNHEVVPTPLIVQLSGLRSHGSGPAHRAISNLAKAGLIAKVKNAKYDGYRLTYGGLDYLALHSHTRSSAVVQLGSQMGVGKESDIHLVTTPTPTASLTPSTTPAPADSAAAASPPTEQAILKIHRLGRTSFRTLSNNRAYQGKRAHCSWQYLSRLSAQKEYAAMQSLYTAGFPVPRPIAQNRHTVVMSLIPGIPLRQVGPEDLLPLPPTSTFLSTSTSSPADPPTDEPADSSPPNPATDPTLPDPERVSALYASIMSLTLRLASAGVIHGDFNEFNILVESPFLTAASATAPLPAPTPENTRMTAHLIDFPQITSMLHPSAREYFDRDVECIKTYFRKRYRFESADPGPSFEEAVAGRRASVAAGRWVRGLDVEIEAAGFSRKMGRELEEAIEAERGVGGSVEDDDEDRDAADEDDDDDDGGDGGDIVPDADAGLVDAVGADVQTDNARPSGHGADTTDSASHEDDSVQNSPQPVLPAAVALPMPLSNRPKEIPHPTKVRQSTKAVAGWAI